MDSIWRKLIYSLHLLIEVRCFKSLPIDHGRWFAAKCRMRAFVIVELDAFSDASFGFWSGLLGMQIDALIFQRPPEPFN